MDATKGKGPDVEDARMKPIADIIAPIVSRARAVQLELFGGRSTNGNAGWNEPASEPWERRDGRTSQTLAVDSSDRGPSDQDRHTSAVRRAPVQTNGLARPPETFRLPTGTTRR